MSGIIYCPACKGIAGWSGTTNIGLFVGETCKCVSKLSYGDLLKERDALRVELDAIAKLIHYPDCWDTTAYPNLSDAMNGVTEYYFTCAECAVKKTEAE